MERRFILFLVFSFLFIALYTTVMSQLRPPRKAVDANVAQQKQADAKKGEVAEPSGKDKNAEKAVVEKAEAGEAKKADGEAVKGAEEAEPQNAVLEKSVPEQWLTLGSLDEDSPYRMLVTLTNKGGAIARLEMSSPRYCNIDDRFGYLGNLVIDEGIQGNGCPVQIVGAGTPAAEAGLKPGDLITSFNDKPITSAGTLNAALRKTKPKQTVSITIKRDGEEKTLTVKLRRIPLDVIQPEGKNPLSFLLTMKQIDDEKIAEDKQIGNALPIDDKDLEAILAAELPGVKLRDANWEIVPQNDREAVVFRKTLPKYGLEVYKTYRLTEVPEKSIGDADYKAYHLTFEIKIANAGKAARKIAYRLDGPTGLPTEGAWYANKVSGGLRDVVISLNQTTPVIKTCFEIADNAATCLPASDPAISYIAVDAQYFSAALIPKTNTPNDIWFATSQPIRVGPIDKDRKNQTDVTFRLNSYLRELNAGESFEQKFDIFAGPKRPALLKTYELGGLVYYGWFWWVAEPMLAILHSFYAIIPNYGIAIILLTVLVRGCMFPMSRKQAVGAQKMAEIQPEMKRLAEKYKKDPQARTKAMQELYRKHNYNPLSGCLVLFVQLPIFLGLYRSLMVDVELRDAPLISHAVRWCSNLAAPDMLFNWSPFMPDFINNGIGMFGLGRYFNILPIVTILLFLWQQKKMMPPPTDEQQAMQQKVMKYMMYFMAILFYKVASGLCVYFIASTLWGLAERKFLPKTHPPKPAVAVARK